MAKTFFAQVFFVYCFGMVLVNIAQMFERDIKTWKEVRNKFMSTDPEAQRLTRFKLSTHNWRSLRKRWKLWKTQVWIPRCRRDGGSSDNSDSE